MKIKHFIVTYNNKERLNSSLGSIFSSESDLSNVEIYILNNHSNIVLLEEFSHRVTILNNQTRPDFSTGHLSRSWNQAIINGFEDINNPSCDIVIATQDDTLFSKKYIEKTVELSKSFDYISYGTGDQFAMYLPKAVKRIGLWDERMCNIGFQEADYFIRAVRYHGDRSSINDQHHGRTHNAIHEANCCPIIHTQSGMIMGDKAHQKSLIYHRHSEHVFFTKWGVKSMFWDADHIKLLKSIEPKIMSFILYPYFEKDVETLREQKYLIV